MPTDPNRCLVSRTSRKLVHERGDEEAAERERPLRERVPAEQEQRREPDEDRFAVRFFTRSRCRGSRERSDSAALY